MKYQAGEAVVNKDSSPECKSVWRFSKWDDDDGFCSQGT
jgi:hypothetical protein